LSSSAHFIFFSFCFLSKLSECLLEHFIFHWHTLRSDPSLFCWTHTKVRKNKQTDVHRIFRAHRVLLCCKIY
jgi:hypothetical protein